MRVLYYDRDIEEREVIEVERISYDKGTVTIMSEATGTIVLTQASRDKAMQLMTDILKNGYVDMTDGPYYMESWTIRIKINHLK